MTQLISDPASALAAAQELYEGEGLPFPPLRDSAAKRLQQVAATVFATRELPAAIYSLTQFVAELTSGDVSDYTAFGFDGHGLISQAVHYYCVTNNAAVLLQFRWGTALDDPQTDRKRYAALMRIAEALLERADEAVAHGKTPEGERIVAIYSSFTGSRWSWVPREGVPAGEFQWRQTETLALSESIADLHRPD